MTEKAKFLKAFNEAYAKSDIDFILNNVTDSIQWEIVGDKSISGIKEFEETLKKMVMDQDYTLDIGQIITHGKEAAVSGVMISPDGNRYRFCDLYTFSGFKNPKVSAMTSFVMEE